MVEIHIRNQNNIINAIPIGKTLIRGRTGGSPYLLNPIDILLSSLGICIGGKIVDYCRLNDVDASIFQSIFIDWTNEEYIIRIQAPVEFERWRLEKEITTCSIAKLLNNKVIVNWTENTIPIEELKKETKPCCGG